MVSIAHKDGIKGGYDYSSLDTKHQLAACDSSIVRETVKALWVLENEIGDQIVDTIIKNTNKV